MHEQSSSYLTREAILDHPTVRRMDPHERHALSERLQGLSPVELARQLRQIRES